MTARNLWFLVFVCAILAILLYCTNAFFSGTFNPAEMDKDFKAITIMCGAFVMAMVSLLTWDSTD